MREVLKFIKKLKKRGYASKDEKVKLAEMLADLKEADQEALADDTTEVNDLPEENPEGSDEDDDVDEDVEKRIKSLFDRHAERIESNIKSELDKHLQEHKSIADKKAGIYHPEVQGKRKEINEKFLDFTKALLAGETAKLKEMTSDSTGSPFAGYTVDSTLSAEIRHLITEYGVARREMTVFPLTTGQLDANNLATDISAFWVDEGSTIKSSEVVLGQESLTLKKLAVIVTLTNELLEETEIDFIGFVGGRVAEQFAKKEDEAFFDGDGTSTSGSFTGLLRSSDVNEVTMAGTTFASIDADNLIDMRDATPQGALANGKYYMHRTIMSYVRKLKDDQGQYIYQAPSDGGPATIWGDPVVLVEAMPDKDASAADKSFVLFGDLRKACILGIRAEGLKAARSNSAVVRNVDDDGDINTFTTDREAIRWIERTGYIAILPKAVTKLTTAPASA